MKNEELRVARMLRKLESLVRLLIALVIALLIALGAFATNIYNATELGEQMQAVAAQGGVTR